MKEKFLSSVYLLIKNDKGEIILNRRKGTNLWPGFLALPAGHIDKNENAYDAIKRESYEELGITIDINDIIDTFVVNRRNKSLEPYYDVYFVINKYKGNIRICEPNKSSELKWVKINELPNDMITFEKIAINNYLNGIKFSVIDTDNEEKLKNE